MKDSHKGTKDESIQIKNALLLLFLLLLTLNLTVYTGVAHYE